MRKYPGVRTSAATGNAARVATFGMQVMVKDTTRLTAPTSALIAEPRTTSKPPRMMQSLAAATPITETAELG